MSTTTAVAPLTIQDAETLVAEARRAAEAAGVTVSITVLDAGGHLLAFRRDDRAVLISGETSTPQGVHRASAERGHRRPRRGRPARRSLPHPAHGARPAAVVHRRRHPRAP
jgi:hypothetical protein